MEAHLTDAVALRQGEHEAGQPRLAEAAPQRSLDLKTGFYVALVVLAALACIGVFARRMESDRGAAYITLIALAIAFERVGLKIYGDTHVSAGVVPLFAIAVLYGAPGAALASPVVVVGATLRSPANWYQRLFDMGSYTVANVCAALTFHVFPGSGRDASRWWLIAAPFGVVVNYGVNTALVAIAVSLSSGQRAFAVWHEEHQWLFPYYIVFGALGLALAAAYEALGLTGIMAFVAPPLMMRVSLHQYVNKTEATVLELKDRNVELETANQSIMAITRQLAETYDGTLEALVLALDARDHETKGHSFRVAEHVMKIARQLSAAENTQEWTDMHRGALLHDVGKIGVPDYILHKPGPLTPEEWGDMKRHPDIGHEMLKDIKFLSGAAEIVHCHHERFDGKGYPRGLTGDEIPIGARIFAVADTFDSMTSDRPYRRGLPPEVARDEIVRHSGTQFDPGVVQAFLLIYEEIAKDSPTGRHVEHARAA